MTKRSDDLTRELHRLDPVEPGELEHAAGSAAAAELLERIVAAGFESPADRLPGRPRRRRLPGPALSAVGAAAVAALVLALVLVLRGLAGGGDDDDLAATLDKAAATAAAQSPPTTARPYTYLKTREVSVSTNAADRRSWQVLQSTTREEWVTRDGAGRLRIVDGPSRFVGSGDRAEWEGAGEPQFLTLGFGRRTEDRWLDTGMLRGGVEELPVDPGALAARLHAKAEVERGGMPVNAATLQLIAEDLRDPAASPERRRALYEAVKRVPGIEYLGEATDPVGRRGVAVGVAGPRSAGPMLYSLIFDPGTSAVLATEATSSARVGGDSHGSPTLLKARVYLESRGLETMTGNGGEWLSGFEPSTSAGHGPSSLVYRIPDLGRS